VLRLDKANIYYLMYRKWQTDRFPLVYVIWSNNQDTMALNIHYAGKLFLGRQRQSQWVIRATNLNQSLLVLGRYRRHPALRVFFSFIESPRFSRMPWKSRYPYLRARWPRITELLIRQYKTPFMKVNWMTNKKSIDLAIMKAESNTWQIHSN